MNDRGMWISATCKGIAESADQLSRKSLKFIETKSGEDLEEAKTEIRTIAGLLNFVIKQITEEKNEIRRDQSRNESL